MTDSDFWTLIAQSADADVDEQLEQFRRSLLQRRPDDVVAFDRHVRRRMAEAYRHDLWGAAYLINGGASDDGFEYFRLWLIGRGQKVYEAALASPDSLALLPGRPEDVEFESLLYLASQVYEEMYASSDSRTSPRGTHGSLMTTRP